MLVIHQYINTCIRVSSEMSVYGFRGECDVWNDLKYQMLDWIHELFCFAPQLPMTLKHCSMPDRNQ